MAFRIQPHVRLHEWVADERGFFDDEGLEYEFETAGLAGGSVTTGAGAVPGTVSFDHRSGAVEDMEQGRTSDVSCACDWAVNAASTGEHGRMYGGAYSVCPSAIFVPPESAHHRPVDLADVEVGVGYHSGSHYSAIQALEPFLSQDAMRIGFVGLPFDRVRLMLQRRIPAANVWGAQHYILEQLGFRKLVDTTFVMGFLLSPQVDRDDVEPYFRALLRAQQEIDLEPQRCLHYWLREMPDDLAELVDVRRFGPGERIVPQPYTREMFERSQRWMRAWNLIAPDAPAATYDKAVLA